VEVETRLPFDHPMVTTTAEAHPANPTIIPQCLLQHFVLRSRPKIRSNRGSGWAAAFSKYAWSLARGAFSTGRGRQCAKDFRPHSI